MRKYLHINLKQQSITSEELNGESVAQAGRYFIAKTLLEQGVAKVDPLSAENSLQALLRVPSCVEQTKD